MDRQERLKTLRKFSRGKRVSLVGLIGPVVLAAPIIAFTVWGMTRTLAMGETPMKMFGLMFVLVFFGVVFLVLPMGLLLMEIRRIRRNVFNNKVEAYREEGKLDALLDEFESARPVLSKNLRLGEDHVFSRRNETAFFPYGEIARLYWEREVDQDTGNATNYFTMQVRPDGAEKPERLRVCSIGKKEMEELDEVVRFMMAKNPDIQDDLHQQ